MPSATAIDRSICCPIKPHRADEISGLMGLMFLVTVPMILLLPKRKNIVR